VLVEQTKKMEVEPEEGSAGRMSLGEKVFRSQKARSDYKQKEWEKRDEECQLLMLERFSKLVSETDGHAGGLDYWSLHECSRSGFSYLGFQKKAKEKFGPWLTFPGPSYYEFRPPPQ
jgi:hypothetical protein